MNEKIAKIVLMKCERACVFPLCKFTARTSKVMLDHLIGFHSDRAGLDYIDRNN